MVKLLSVKNAFNQEHEETTRDVWDATDEFKREQQLGPTAAAAPENLSEGSVSDSD